MSKSFEGVDQRLANTTIDINTQFQLALNLIERGEPCLFVTGKAGTGKSTFLHHLCSITPKRFIILAPTGIAALNVGGQTIHSFFQFPIGLIERKSIRRGRNASIMRDLDLLIIDEVSMVRADLMDGIDMALRLNRGKWKVPFGGVQVVCLGDAGQLSPIVKSHDEEAYFSDFYSSPYFFSAKVFNELSPAMIEFSEVYRQRDPIFLNILNTIRTGMVTDEITEQLNIRIVENPPEGAITLTTTNAVAAKRNKEELDKLTGESQIYRAHITGEFEAKLFPAEEELTLKKNAQIMMLRNDGEGRWVNGTICRVAGLGFTGISVDVDGQTYTVGTEQWENVRYHYDLLTQKISKETLGTFEQFPIKLAYAITVHRSQGCTFDKVHLDLGRGSFAHGQTYVALSRCTSLGGLTLNRSLSVKDLVFDKRANEYENIFKRVS